MYPKKPPKLVPSYVCFADILGYSELSRESLEKGEGNKFLNKLHKALGRAYKRVRKQSKGWSDSKYFSIKIFTDNIVVGYPLTRLSSTAGEPELGQIFSVFAEFQVGLAMEGFLVRGGIAAGDHFMDKDVVFGDALLDAVAQDKNGGAPRITLAPSVIDLLRVHLGFYGDGKYAPQHNDLLEDADGNIFLDYLSQAFIAYPEGGIFFDVIKKHKNTIAKGLKKYKGNPDVRAKYEWAARYHNYVCKNFREMHPLSSDPDADPEWGAAAYEAQKLEDFEINIENLAPSPQKISLAPIHRERHV